MAEKRAAVVGAEGIVENVIVIDDDVDPFELPGFLVVEDTKRKAKIGGRHDRDRKEFVDPPDPEELRLAPVIVSRKIDVWERATEEEADALEAALASAPAKVRRTWEDSWVIDHAGPMFKELRDLIGKAVKTKKRADELLAPREDQ